MNARAKPDTIVQAADINNIIIKARELQPFDPERRLGALVFALVVECQSAGLDKHEALRRVREAFNTKIGTTHDMAAAPGIAETLPKPN